MIEVKYEQPGQCPRCGGTDISYGPIEPEGDQIFYPFECENCGLEAKEYYNITLEGLYVDEKYLTKTGKFRKNEKDL